MSHYNFSTEMASAHKIASEDRSEMIRAFFRSFSAASRFALGFTKALPTKKPGTSGPAFQAQSFAA